VLVAGHQNPCRALHGAGDHRIVIRSAATKEPVTWPATTTAIAAKLAPPFVHVLFGARQAGKSTLLNTLLPAAVR
jgi:putative ribosome biogenesis GTPase RsgA